MQAISASASSINCNIRLLPQKAPTSHQSRRVFGRFSAHHRLQLLQKHKQFAPLGYDPLRVLRMAKKGRGTGAVCYSAPLAPGNLQWVSAVSTAVLMLARGTAIHKSFLVPLFVLQAPGSIFSWMKGEYGIWTAFLALLVRLFFFIPGELELPFITLMLVIVSPYQITRLRGTKEGVILSLVIAAYLAFQHFTRVGSLGKAFDQGSIIATLATICIVAVPCLLLI